METAICVVGRRAWLYDREVRLQSRQVRLGVDEKEPKKDGRCHRH